ncbi:MAG: hypothetical protein VXW43_13215 [Pseudomonadota bacterium]|nr:hypothetical protein [Pseudomonadota bacterium]
MSDTPDIPQDAPLDDDRIFAAEYVLGLLSTADHRAFEARMDGDPIPCAPASPNGPRISSP